MTIMMDLSVLSLLTLFSLGRVEANIKGEFCTDVSTYSDVIWHDGEPCRKKTIGEPDVQEAPVQLMITHNETKCHAKIVEESVMEPMVMEPTMCFCENNTFSVWATNMTNITFTHIKHRFHCELRNRSICETEWITGDDGKKVGVPGPCQTVQWKDCWKVPYNATFTTMKSHKYIKENITYYTCMPMPMPVTLMKWHVKKKLVSVCETKEREEWVPVEEKWVTPTLITPPDDPNKPQITFPQPWQNRTHREKCLQPGGPDEGHHGDHGPPTTPLQPPPQRPQPYQQPLPAVTLRGNNRPPGRFNTGGRRGREGTSGLSGGRKRKALDFDEALKGLQETIKKATPSD